MFFLKFKGFSLESIEMINFWEM